MEKTIFAQVFQNTEKSEGVGILAASGSYGQQHGGTGASPGS
jgi:hypothetical protein